MCSSALSWSDWGSRLSRVQVSIELLTMHHYYWTQVPLIPWYVTMIYKKDFSGLFNNRTARLFVFYQCSIRFFLTKIFLNFTLFTFFHNLIFTDRRKFIMWEPIFLGQSFFTSFPISLTTFSTSCCNFWKPKYKNKSSESQSGLSPTLNTVYGMNINSLCVLIIKN